MEEVRRIETEFVCPDTGKIHKLILKVVVRKDEILDADAWVDEVIE